MGWHKRIRRVWEDIETSKNIDIDDMQDGWERLEDIYVNEHEKILAKEVPNVYTKHTEPNDKSTLIENECCPLMVSLFDCMIFGVFCLIVLSAYLIIVYYNLPEQPKTKEI